MKEKLAIKEQMKARQPRFVRQDAHRFAGKMGEVWRKPRGRHSKMRLSKKGKAVMVRKGYRSPLSVRGMTREGYVPISIFNRKDLEKVDSKKHIVIIGGLVGKKKKLEIITAAQQKGIRFLNVKDPSRYKKQIENDIEERKKERALRAKKKEKKEVKEKKTLEERSEKTEEQLEREKETKRREAEKTIIQK